MGVILGLVLLSYKIFFKNPQIVLIPATTTITRLMTLRPMHLDGFVLHNTQLLRKVHEIPTVYMQSLKL